MPPQILRKAVDAEIQVDFAKREIIGYGSTFGNIDNHGDVVAPGAFTKTLAERVPKRLVKNFLCHAYPTGLLKHAEQDSRGLLVVLGAEEGSAEADRQLRWAANGITSHMSIGYDVIQSREIEHPATKAKANLLQELRLWEVSTVIWPANEEATVMGVKGEEPLRLTKGLSDLASVLSALAWVKFVMSSPDAKLSDEDVALVREVLEQMQATETDLYALVGEPATDTGEKSEPRPLVATPTVEVVSKSLTSEDAAALASLTARLTLGRTALENARQQLNR